MRPGVDTLLPTLPAIAPVAAEACHLRPSVGTWFQKRPSQPVAAGAILPATTTAPLAKAAGVSAREVIAQDGSQSSASPFNVQASVGTWYARVIAGELFTRRIEVPTCSATSSEILLHHDIKRTSDVSVPALATNLMIVKPATLRPSVGTWLQRPFPPLTSTEIAIVHPGANTVVTMPESVCEPVAGPAPTLAAESLVELALTPVAEVADSAPLNLHVSVGTPQEALAMDLEGRAILVSKLEEESTANECKPFLARSNAQLFDMQPEELVSSFKHELDQKNKLITELKRRLGML